MTTVLVTPAVVQFVVGPVTNNRYVPNGAGEIIVDNADVPILQALGFVIPTGGGGGGGIIDANGYYVPVTIQNSDATTFTAQPVALRITSVDIPWAHIRSDGGDIRFTESDGVTAVPYFFQSFDSVNKLAVIWVKPATLLPASGSTVAGTTVRMYYGQPGNTVTTASYDNVFAKISPSTSGLIALHHLDDGSGTSAADSKGAFTGVVTGATWDTTSGGNFRAQRPTQSFASGSALIVNGVTQDVTFTGLLDTQGNTTVAFWIMRTGATADNLNIWFKGNTAANDFTEVAFNSSGGLKYQLKTAGVQRLNALTGFTSGSHVLPLNTWVHVAFSYGAAGFQAYVDGEADLIEPAITQVPASGSSFPVIFGNNSGSVAGHYKLSEHAVFNRQLAEWEVKALFERRPLVQIKDAFSKLVNQAGNPIITKGTDHILESNPTVIVAGSSYKNWIHDNTTFKLLYYTSADGIAWTLVSSDALGGRNANSPTVWIHASAFGDTYNMLVNTTNYTAGNLDYYTSPDGTAGSWVFRFTVLAADGTHVAWFSGRPGSVYYPPSGGIKILAEYRDGGGSYHSVLCSGADLGSLSVVGNITGMVGAQGGLNIHVIGSKFYVFNFGSLLSGTNSIPTLGQISISTDLQHYIDAGIMPAIQLHGPVYSEGDQIGDTTAIENFDGAGNLAVYWAGSQDGSTGGNSASGYVINLGTYAGTFLQWVTDNLTPTYGTEIGL